MLLVVVFLAVLQLGIAAVPMPREQDPLIIAIDDIEGMLYELPEYEDPKMIEHQISSFGGVPVFTLLDMAMKRGDYKNEDVSLKEKLSNAKKAIDDVIYKLQLTRSKLEKGSNNIYTDIEKTIQDLKKLERIFRPDVNQLLKSLRASMSIAPPSMLMPDIKDLFLPKQSVLYDKPSAIKMPEKYGKSGISVTLISGSRPALDLKPGQHQEKDSIESSEEKSIEHKKPVYLDVYQVNAVDKERKVVKEPGSIESFDVDKGDYEYSKTPFPSDASKKRNKKLDDEEQINSLQSKGNWK